ncbi:MAG: class I SAM-dependent methyltransferase [Thermoplasmata archaeon]|nr:class I SAM-dependent methyltransferase [Thermoplasmata archaeon]
MADEYVGVDQSFEFLARVRDRGLLPPNALLVEANLYHLPLVDAAATSGLLARVYNFLTRPADALREIRRILSPGGGLILSCHARPSPMTLVDDVRAGLSAQGNGLRPSLTFSRADVVPALPSPFPAFAPTRRFLTSTLVRAGFRSEATFGSGLEDFRWTRFLPSRLFGAAGASLGSAPVFPLVWKLARNGAAVRSPEVAPISSSLACPKCRAPFGPVDLRKDFEIPCASCGFVLRMEERILRARYVAG